MNHRLLCYLHTIFLDLDFQNWSRSTNKGVGYKTTWNAVSFPLKISGLTSMYAAKAILIDFYGLFLRYFLGQCTITYVLCANTFNCHLSHWAYKWAYLLNFYINLTTCKKSNIFMMISIIIIIYTERVILSSCIWWNLCYEISYTCHVVKVTSSSRQPRM